MRLSYKRGGNTGSLRFACISALLHLAYRIKLKMKIDFFSEIVPHLGVF